MRLASFAATALALLLLSCSKESTYAVDRVVDGDTFVVSVDGQREKVRPIGMNTPETVDPRRPVQCFGKQASVRAKQLLEGQRVGLTGDSRAGNRDKYGRLLRYVILPDGRDFALTMISEGYAFENGYGHKYERRDDFKAAEKEARGAGRGLWAKDTCDGMR